MKGLRSVVAPSQKRSLLKLSKVQIIPSIAAVNDGGGRFNTSIKIDRNDTYEMVLVLIQVICCSSIPLSKP